MRYDDITKGLSTRLGTYPGNSTFGMSFLDQFRNANQGLGYLKQLRSDGEVSDEDAGQFDNLVSGVKGLKGSAIAGGIMSGLTAGTQIATNAMQAGQIADTTQQQNEIYDLSRVGSYGYNNFDEVARDYAYTNFNGPDINYKDIRGMNTGQKIANVGSSALSGAQAGMQVGGWVGALAGGLIGGGTSLWGVLAGDKKARTEEAFLNAQADMAASMANQNLTAANERILNNNNRQGAVHSIANGGKIERITIKQYADKVLGKTHQREMKCGGRITRTKGDGGTIIRIRAK